MLSFIVESIQQHIGTSSFSQLQRSESEESLSDVTVNYTNSAKLSSITSEERKAAYKHALGLAFFVTACLAASAAVLIYSSAHCPKEVWCITVLGFIVGDVCYQKDKYDFKKSRESGNQLRYNNIDEHVNQNVVNIYVDLGNPQFSSDELLKQDLTFLPEYHALNSTDKKLSDAFCQVKVGEARNEQCIAGFCKDFYTLNKHLNSMNNSLHGNSILFDPYFFGYEIQQLKKHADSLKNNKPWSQVKTSRKFEQHFLNHLDTYLNVDESQDNNNTQSKYSTQFKALIQHCEALSSSMTKQFPIQGAAQQADAYDNGVINHRVNEIYKELIDLHTKPDLSVNDKQMLHLLVAQYLFFDMVLATKNVAHQEAA